jgi:hypothetical protein
VSSCQFLPFIGGGSPRLSPNKNRFCIYLNRVSQCKNIPDFNHNGNINMNNADFNELAGRIQGLGDFLLHLTSYLEDRQLIDGEHFNQGVMEFAENRCFDGEHLEATKRTLSELAQFLSEARQRRQQAQQTQRHARRRRYHS